MFRRKPTITRSDRDRLVRVTRPQGALLQWALFIDELRREIDRARVISPARVPADLVTMHSTVRLRDVKRGSSEVYTLVYPEDAAPRDGRLSVLTPLGTALLGSRVRDVLRVPSADGTRRIAVDAILRRRGETEASGPEALQAAAASGRAGPADSVVSSARAAFRRR